jgi:hypothetical protein
MLWYVAYMWQVFGPDWHEIHRESAATAFAIPVTLVVVLLLADAVLLVGRFAAGARSAPTAVARSAARGR